jgi:small redox-active disulfide protein 2
MKNNTIQVLGSGCPTCRKLYEITQKAVAELGLEMTVDYINDVQKILDMGLMSSPVLAINDKPVMVGFTSDVNKIKKIIQDNL